MSIRLPGGHSRVLIDTSVWIYHLEKHERLANPAGRIIECIEDGKFRGITSELTLLELTVKPLQLARQDIADDHEMLLGYFPNLQLEPISRNILMDAAGIRARYRLRTPDSIQLATGLSVGATLAVTNVDAWRDFPLIETLILEDLVD
ncbi:MAG: type II toxin-antitoxin system VapC family toxin [Steroidobacteraceae bacterium]